MRRRPVAAAWSTCTRRLIAAARRMAEVLGPEDVIALEQRTALADMGQYVAHRQVLQTANRLEAGAARGTRSSRWPAAQEVPTRVLDEDTYPVGGFTSISTKGTVESLLHSQLAYMERDAERAARPVRREVPARRAVLLLPRREPVPPPPAGVRVLSCSRTWCRPGSRTPTCRPSGSCWSSACSWRPSSKLSEWLSTDALRFEFLLVQDGEGTPLAQEGALLEMLFREQIENGTVEVRHSAEAPGPYADRRAHRSLCHLLAVSAGGAAVRTDLAIATDLTVAGPRPEVRIGYDEPTELPGDDPVESWTATLERLLMVWV